MATIIACLAVCMMFSGCEHEKSDGNQILAFSFAPSTAADVKVDQTAKTITVEVPLGTDVTALSPVIVISFAATVSPASGVPTDFTSPVVYIVTAEDGSNNYYMVTITYIPDNVEHVEGFWLKMGDNSIVTTSDIDFYDISTHMIYLKKESSYQEKVEKDGRGTMSVYVNDEEIYNCSFHSHYLSYLPKGEYISCNPFYYPYDIIHINFLQIIDLNGKPLFTDHRSNERIIAALKKSHLYHEGLHCEIQSVDVSNEKVVLNIELFNLDTFDYYHLDPDKMGIGLFHYYTNGLYFQNDQYQSFTHQETVIHPKPWNFWEKEWLSLIKSGESKNISITY